MKDLDTFFDDHKLSRMSNWLILVQHLEDLDEHLFDCIVFEIFPHNNRILLNDLTVHLENCAVLIFGGESFFLDGHVKFLLIVDWNPCLFPTSGSPLSFSSREILLQLVHKHQNIQNVSIGQIERGFVSNRSWHLQNVLENFDVDFVEFGVSHSF